MKFFLLFLAGGFALWGIGDGTTGLIGGSDKAVSAGEESVSPREAQQKNKTKISLSALHVGYLKIWLSQYFTVQYNQEK